MYNLKDCCKICNRKVQSFCIHIKCTVCLVMFHAKCVNMTKNEIQYYELWYCPLCIQDTLPFNHFDEDDDFKSALLETMCDYIYRLN